MKKNIVQVYQIYKPTHFAKSGPTYRGQVNVVDPRHQTQQFKETSHKAYNQCKLY